MSGRVDGGLRRFVIRRSFCGSWGLGGSICSSSGLLLLQYFECHSWGARVGGGLSL